MFIPVSHVIYQEIKKPRQWFICWLTQFKMAVNNTLGVACQSWLCGTTCLPTTPNTKPCKAVLIATLKPLPVGWNTLWRQIKNKTLKTWINKPLNYPCDIITLIS